MQYAYFRKKDVTPNHKKGSHIKLKNNFKKGVILFPNHGSQELGKGLEKKLFKQAGINR
jgi:predicted RNA binding protein YcfA (HicA-like mRNA interferase family)